MTEHFLGEIRMNGFGHVPRGWALCNGQTLAISTNQALYSLIGTYYGGNGVTTFMLPNLQARIPLHNGIGDGASYAIGQTGGEASHTLSPNEMPSHTHQAQAAHSATVVSPANAVWAGPGKPAFGSTPAAPMIATGIQSSGSSQPHPNLPPYLVVSFVIALQGIFPSRS